MAEIAGAPPCLRICENCPNRNKGQDLAVRQGKAKVLLAETGIVGTYIDSNGRVAGSLRESATGLYLDNSEAYDLFADCQGPTATRFLQKIGIAAPDCPALESLLGGDPSNGDVVGHYAQRIG